MPTQRLMLATLLACMFAPALAAEPDDQAGQPRVERRIVTGHGDAMAFNLDELAAAHAGHGMAFDVGMHGKQVKNAPYSAQVVTERQQNLADGNQIVNKRTSVSYRDSAGRTRQELRDTNGELRTVTIHDPVAGATYILNPRSKTATKVPAPGLVAHGLAAHSAAEAARGAAESARGAAEAARAAATARREEIRTGVEQMRREGKLADVEHSTGPNGEEIIIKRVERNGNGSPEDVRIRVEQKIIGKGERLAPLAGAFGDMKWSAKATTRDLGTRDFNGVKAEGKQRSYEIPAGEVGNRNPIVVSHESWYSPELQVTVYTKHSDPRTGESIYRLEGLRREEPAPALFTIPSDYKVRDVMAAIKRKTEQQAQ